MNQLPISLLFNREHSTESIWPRLPRLLQLRYVSKLLRLPFGHARRRLIRGRGRGSDAAAANRDNLLRVYHEAP